MILICLSCIAQYSIGVIQLLQILMPSWISILPTHPMDRKHNTKLINYHRSISNLDVYSITIVAFGGFRMICTMQTKTCYAYHIPVEVMLIKFTFFTVEVNKSTFWIQPIFHT